MKTSKLWNYLKSQLETCKGFWHLPEEKSSASVLKVSKQQDRLHRRFFLKPVNNSNNTVYLSHEKRLAQAESNKKLMIRLSYSLDSPINRKTLHSSRHKTPTNTSPPLNVVEEEDSQLFRFPQTSRTSLQKIKETLIEVEEECKELQQKQQPISAEEIKSSVEKPEEIGVPQEIAKLREHNLEFLEESAQLIENENSQHREVNSEQSLFFEGLTHIQSEQLMQKKRAHCNLIVNRSATRSKLNSNNNNTSELKLLPFQLNSSERQSARKREYKNKLIKKSRKLEFPNMELKKFSDKEVEKLEVEAKDRPSLRNSSQRAQRRSKRFAAGGGSENLQRCFAEKITLKGGHYGLIEITKEDFVFTSLGFERPDHGPLLENSNGNTNNPHAPAEKDDPLYELFPLGIDAKQLLKSHCKKQWNLSEIVCVQGRSYNLRACAFELFTVENKAYFFNVYDPKIAESVCLRFQKLKKNKLDFFYHRAEAFKLSGAQEKWLKGQISNFEYLAIINTYAGRTYNDINQYPVFPWVLKDYKSAKLDLSSPSVFRDFSLPVGALLSHRLEEAREHYETLKLSESALDLFDKPFQYGTHYSGLGPVSYFLIRLEPFTTEHIKLQSGNFDDADRLFASVPQTWEICLERDFKELLPEMFYLPDFLMNKNGFDFGKGNSIGSVVLPSWARSPYEFVFLHREALESEHVTRNLHKWIDLVFGYKQQGQAAVDADNVFRFLTYEGAVDLTTISDSETKRNYLEYITKLGQTPHQLFTQKHPNNTGARIDTRNLLRNSSSVLAMEKDEGLAESSIVCMGVCSNNTDLMLFLRNNCLVYLPLDEHVGAAANFQTVKRKIFQVNTKFSANELAPAAQIYAFRNKKRVVLLGGAYDGSLKVFVKGKEIRRNEGFVHKKPINCVEVCECSKVIACGSKDCRISLWKYDKEMNIRGYTEAAGGGLVYGHNNEVVVMKINEVLGILISVDRDGVVLTHEISRGRFLKKIALELERDEFVNQLDIHENGIVLVGTTLCRVLFYRFI